MRNTQNIAQKWDMIKATSICTNLSVHIRDETKHLKSGFMCNVHPTMIFVFVFLQRLFLCFLPSAFCLLLSQSNFIQWVIEWERWAWTFDKHGVTIHQNIIPTTKRVFFFFIFQMELTQKKIHLVKVEWDKSIVFLYYTRIPLKCSMLNKNHHYPNN